MDPCAISEQSAAIVAKLQKIGSRRLSLPRGWVSGIRGDVMRHLSYLLAVLLTCGGWLFSSPTTSLPEDQGVILVLPFNSSGGPNAGWMGKAVQQDLLTDLAQATKAVIKAPGDAAPAADPAAALRAARDAGASLVVFGQVQTTGSEVRLTGQVLDVASGRPVGNLKATGPAENLFHLEDALAGQALTAVPRPMLNSQALQSPQQATGQEPLAAAASAPTAAPSGDAPPASAAADPYAVPPPDYYQTAPPVSTYSYTDYEPAPVYSYPIPAYTYACPSYDLFPFCDPIVSLDLGFFGVGRSHFHDGRFHDGRFHDHGSDGHVRNGAGPAVTGGHAQSGGQVAARARGGSGFSQTYARRGGYAAAASPTYRSASIPRGSPSAASRARPSFTAPRSYSGSGMRSGGSFGSAFRGGGSPFRGGAMGSHSGFHGGGGSHGGGGRR